MICRSNRKSRRERRRWPYKASLGRDPKFHFIAGGKTYPRFSSRKSPTAYKFLTMQRLGFCAASGGCREGRQPHERAASSIGHSSVKRRKAPLPAGARQFAWPLHAGGPAPISLSALRHIAPPPHHLL